MRALLKTLFEVAKSCMNIILFLREHLSWRTTIMDKSLHVYLDNYLNILVSKQPLFKSKCYYILKVKSFECYYSENYHFWYKNHLNKKV